MQTTMNRNQALSPSRPLCGRARSHSDRLGLNARRARLSPACDVPSRASRRGSVLVIVLVVVALLALGAYTFAEFMSIEQMATTTYGREVQARAAADSGIELAAALLARRYEASPQSYQSSPQTFEGVLVQNSNSARGRARFSIVSSAEWDTSGRSLRFGLTDESAKLNLNTLAKMLSQGTIQSSAAETLLTSISPDITPEIADAIIDWLDSDDTQMTNGAESDYYQSLVPPYPAKNNLLDSLDELLLVKGMTPTLLFGEDTNHNGLLDPEENDGSASPPLDNSDGQLQRGLSQYFTIFSREINLRSDGEPKININQSDMQKLYSDVLGQFDQPTATFIVAYRMFGPTGGSSSGGSGCNSGSGSGGNTMASSGSGSGSGGGSSGRSSSGGSGGGSGGASGGSSRSSGGSSGGSGASSPSGGGSQGGSSNRSPAAAKAGSGTMVAGIDVSNGPTYTIKSLYELPGARTQGTVNSQPSTSVTNPWATTTTSALSQCLPLIIDKLSLTDAPYIDGRININLASHELIAAVITSLTGTQSSQGSSGSAPSSTSTPSSTTSTSGQSSSQSSLTVAVADQIVAAQMKSTSGSSVVELPPDRLMSAWLVIDGILSSINTLEQLDPYITGRGDAFHFQSIGYFEGGGPMARIEAVVDATQIPPRAIFVRDLTELGHGFTATLLSTGAGSTR